MTTGQLTDLLVTHSLNPGSNDVNDQDIRKRVLERAQETVEEIWDESDWDFKQKTTTLTLTAGQSSTDAPEDFVTIGENGQLFITNASATYELRYQTPGELYRARAARTGGTGIPECYTIVQQDATYRTQIQFDYAADTTYTLTIFYDSTPPLLMDRPIAPTVTYQADLVSGLNGTYSYRIVFVAVDGTESEAGATVSATPAVEDVILSGIPTGNAYVSSRKVYRTSAYADGYWLVSEILDNTTTTFTDMFGDGTGFPVDAMTATADSSTLQRIPRNYHHSVVLKGVLARLARDYADGRAQQFDNEYRHELGRMKSRRVHGIEDQIRLGEEGLSRWRMH